MHLHSKKEFLSQNEKLPEALNTQYGLDTALMSDSLKDASDSEVANTRKVLVDLGVPEENVSEADAKLFRDGSKYVGLRAARLSACALAAVIESEVRENAKGDINIGLDGSWVDFLVYCIANSLSKCH